MNKLTTLLLMASLLAISACTSNNKSADRETEMDTEMQSSSTKRFDQLVSDMFAQTSDTAKPVNTNKLSIEFNHDEANFDNLF